MIEDLTLLCSSVFVLAIGERERERERERVERETEEKKEKYYMNEFECL